MYAPTKYGSAAIAARYQRSASLPVLLAREVARLFLGSAAFASSPRTGVLARASRSGLALEHETEEFRTSAAPRLRLRTERRIRPRLEVALIHLELRELMPAARLLGRLETLLEESPRFATISGEAQRFRG